MSDFVEKTTQKVKHIDKKKRHGRGFNESHDIMASRKARVGFKQYLRELEEQDHDYDLSSVDDDDYDEVD